MKRPLIIANWKSHKTIREAEEWFAIAASEVKSPSAVEVVLCPSFPLLEVCKKLIKKYHFGWKLGAQDVSSFPEGKHTGEVNAGMLRDFVEYVLIGHHERREELHEIDEILFSKVARVQEAGLMPIFFIQDEKTTLPKKIDIVAYEPVFAIGTGNPDNPEHVEKVAHYLKTIRHIPHVLYGGSVDAKNVGIFMSFSDMDGVVPGTASLDPKELIHLIANA